MKAKWMLAAVAATAMSMTAARAADFSGSDKDFLKDAAQGNVTEVELSKLALDKSDNAKVKAFAQKMITDHTKLGKNMAPFLAQAGVQVDAKLDSDGQSEYNKLKDMNAADFNKEFVAYMDKDHHKDLKAFQDEFNSTKNMQLKTAVHKGETVIQSHVTMIDAIDKGMGMTPAS